VSGTDWLRGLLRGPATLHIGDQQIEVTDVVIETEPLDPGMPGRLDLRAAGGPLIAYAASGRAQIISTPEPTPPRDIPWANPVHTDGACVHDVIYSSCQCDLRNPAAL
jgi:hypothetical protein